MAEPTLPPAPSTAPLSGSTAATYKAPQGNAALRMMGFPNLPKKLPSRNWMIFWTITASFTAAVIYDKREKKRATARWTHAVSHLATETIKNPNQLPRRITIYLESPPAEGLRVAQDHFTEYIKPILAASGLDWEFVQGRREGDVRAAVAEKIRRTRRETEEPPTDPVLGELTGSEIIEAMRKRQGTPQWSGVGGDIVVGRHTWKEYIRGLHEGWLGPLSAPHAAEGTTELAEGEKKEEEKPSRPPQIPPYNTPNDYASSSLLATTPAEFSPTAPITFPHILGFSNTFIRLGRFLNRRHLADEIGREVAAVCLATSRKFQEGSAITESEQQVALVHEEKDWPSSVWKETPQEADASPAAPAEKIWTNPVVTDPRLDTRMRRFELRPDDEARAREIVVPEEEVEGWIKGSFRRLYRWAVSDPAPRPYWSDE